MQPEVIRAPFPAAGAWESLRSQLPTAFVPDEIAEYVDDPLEHEVLCHVGFNGGSSSIDRLTPDVFGAATLGEEEEKAFRLFVFGLAHRNKLVVTEHDEIFLPYSLARQQRLDEQIREVVTNAIGYWSR